jgi:expansin (peptidoglycan-binding protein)
MTTAVIKKKGSFQLTHKSSKGFVTTNPASGDIHLEPGENCEISIGDMKSLARSINTAPHNEYINTHVMQGNSGWRATIQVLDHITDTVEYINENLSDMLTIALN